MYIYIWYPKWKVAMTIFATKTNPTTTSTTALTQTMRYRCELTGEWRRLVSSFSVAHRTGTGCSSSLALALWYIQPTTRDKHVCVYGNVEKLARENVKSPRAGERPRRYSYNGVVLRQSSIASHGKCGAMWICCGVHGINWKVFEI